MSYEKKCWQHKFLTERGRQSLKYSSGIHLRYLGTLKRVSVNPSDGHLQVISQFIAKLQLKSWKLHFSFPKHEANLKQTWNTKRIPMKPFLSISKTYILNVSVTQWPIYVSTLLTFEKHFNTQTKTLQADQLCSLGVLPWVAGSPE